MNVHKNARLTPYRRQELVARVEQGEPLTAIARALDVSRQTARKWVARKASAGVRDPRRLDREDAGPRVIPRS